MALLPPAQIEHDVRGWHVRQGEVQLEGRALPQLLERLSLTMEALAVTADLDQALRRDTDSTAQPQTSDPRREAETVGQTH